MVFLKNSKQVLSFYIPIRGILEFQLFHILINTWYSPSYFILVILITCSCILWGYTSLMTNDIEHHVLICLEYIFFTCLKCLFKFFTYFYWVVFLLLSLEIVFYILKSIIRYMVWKYFLPAYDLNFNFFIVFQKAEYFKISMKPNLSDFFYELYFCCCI